MAVSRRVAVGVLGLVTSTAFALSACSSSGNGGSSSAGSSVGGSTSSAGSTSSGGSYSWGLNAELSGAVSYYGLSEQAGIEAYIDQVNAAGGINGHKITLTSLDNAGDESRSAADATQLATADKVDAIFGNSLSSDCTGAQSVVDRYKVPMACLSVDSADPYIFNMGADNSSAGKAMIQAAQKVTGKSNIKAALVYINTLTDEQLAKALPGIASGAGATIATSQEISLTATDVSAQVAEVVAAKPDVVLISETGPGLISVLKGVRAAGITAPFVWVDGTGNIPSLATSTDQNVYVMNVYQVVLPGATASGAASYIKAITPKLSGAASLDTLNGGEAVPAYMTASAFGAALKTCGYPCTGANLKTALEKTTISLPGLVSSYSLSSTDHYPYKNWYIYHVVGSTTTLVDTLPAS